MTAAVGGGVPDGLALRPATVEDAAALAGLINAVNLAEIGLPLTTDAEVLGELTLPGRIPDNDVVLVEDDGTIVGYLTLSVDEDGGIANQLAWTRPDRWGHGLSRWLLELGERRAAALVRDTGALLHVACWSTNDAARRLFDALGYAYVRTFHELRRTLDGTLPRARVPQGITIRSFDLDSDARRAHAALAEAFDDHWGRRFDPYDEWAHHAIHGEGAAFDARLWFVALEGAEIVGVTCTRATMASTPDTASVDALGVRAAWRGRGVARALLLSTFEAVQRRGIGAIQLGVDSTNPTGATRLYEGVGMHIIRSFEIWEKELRA